MLAAAHWLVVVAACATPPTGVRDGFSDRTVPAEDLPGTVRRLADEIDVHNAQPTFEARFLTFERRGAAAAYGVYAAHDAKSHMRVPAPLHGDPIAWPDRDHTQALVWLLEITGVEPGRARALVERNAEVWFGEGLRVFVTAPGALWIFELDP